MRLGLATTPLSLKALLQRRWFATRVELPALWRDYYRRMVTTLGVPPVRPHALVRAF
jgi:hypothetical protein